MITILLLLAALPARGMRIQYDYREPTQSLNPANGRNGQSLNPANGRSSAAGESSEPEAFGVATARAIFMKPSRMGTSDLARKMMNDMEIVKDFFGPAFDRPIGDMVDTLMQSTPQEIVHGIIDPIMSSPRSQETLGNLDRQLADFFTSQLGDDVLDTLDNEFLGGNTISSLIEYASGELPRITAFQFALQLMFQFQVQFASMMDITTTFGEMIEPITNMLAQIPDVTPSEAVQMLAEPVMRNDVNLGSLDESVADFIKGLETSPGSARCPAPESFGRTCFQYLDQCSSNDECVQGQSCCLVAGCGHECVAPGENIRPVNEGNSRNRDINRQSSDNFGREQADFARLGDASQNTSPQNTNLDRQDFPEGSGRFQAGNNQQSPDQRSGGFPGHTGQQFSGQGSGGFPGRTGQQSSGQGSGGFQGRTGQQSSGQGSGGFQGRTGQQFTNQGPSGFQGNTGQQVFRQRNDGSNFAELQQQEFDIPDPFAETGQTSRTTGSQLPGQTSRNSGSQQQTGQTFGNPGFQQQPGQTFRNPGQTFGNPGFQQQPGQTFGNPGFQQQPGQTFGNTGFQQQPGQTFGNTGFQQQPGQNSRNPGFQQTGQSSGNTGFQQPSQSSGNTGIDFGSSNPGSPQPSQTNTGFQQTILNPIIQSIGSGFNQVNRFFGNGPDQSENQVAGRPNTRSSSVSGGSSSNQNAGQYYYTEPNQPFQQG